MGKTKKKDHRSASLTRRQSMREVKQSFLIVCEGVRTEPDYFKAFRMTAATVKAVGQAMNTTSLVSKAISIRDADQKKKRTYDQCWVVFDKDDFPAKDFNDANRLLHLQPQAIKNASAVLADVSHGNPAMEESSTTVHLLVEELNRFI